MSATVNTPIIEARNLNLRFGTGANAVQALDHVNLTIARGQRLGVVGESGSGKSTLLKVLDGLRRPDEGDVLFAGSSILASHADLRPLRAQVSMVFQDPRSCLDPRMRVGRIITEPLRSRMLRGTVDDVPDALERVMAEVGLDPDDRDRYPHEFSGGQRQRIAIARALITNPTVLLADEPVSALDVSVRAQVLNLLTRLVDERGLTLVLVSHDLAVVRHLCQEVAVIQDGRIVESGNLAQVYAEPRHDLTRRLLAAVPTIRGLAEDRTWGRAAAPHS